MTNHDFDLFSRGSWPEVRRINELLRRETVGGILLLVATVAALLWANLATHSYQALRDFHIGPAALHLDLSLGHWAADGLLAIFFFLAGLELKHEFTVGDLRDPRRAALPVVAALGGMIGPALVFTALNLRTGEGALQGWAIPTATDIAFALAVLAVVGTHLPSALRTFLLTLAVVDDLFAITIIAIFYTRELDLLFLGLAVLPLLGFWLLVRRGVSRWWLLVPLALTCWALVHASGVHATVAGVLLGFTIPIGKQADGRDLAHDLEHRLRPISAGIAVPLFAFFAAGVAVGGASGFAGALGDKVALGVVLGLLLGKPLGILASTWAMARFTRARLDESLRWVDMVGLALLAGIGFTVSLLIGELAYVDALRIEHVKVGVLVGSTLAALAAVAVLGWRNRVYKDIVRREESDRDADGIPDLWDPEPDTPAVS